MKGFVFLLLFLCMSVSASPWSWPLTAEHYQRLPVHERSEYNRARDLFQQRQYRAAAATFEGMAARFPESNEIPYYLFMQGYSLHEARDRRTAITLYDEVLDFFMEEPRHSAPAMFYKGVAQIENGDERQGFTTLRQMVSDPDLRHHSLAAGALRRLADNHAANNEAPEAVRYWRQTIEDFSDTNPEEAREALAQLLRHTARSGEFREHLDWWMDPERKGDLAYQVNLLNQVFEAAWDHLVPVHNRNRDVEDGARLAFLTFFAEQQSVYEAAESSWDFYQRDVRFRAQVPDLDAEGTRERFDELIAWTSDVGEVEQRDLYFEHIAERLRDMEQYEEALSLSGRIIDPARMRFLQANILGRQGDYAQAAEIYEEIEGQVEGGGSAERARRARADLYRVRLERHEEAIALYRVMPAPENLWLIADAYRRWGRLDDAIRTYTEIELNFPDLAARAAGAKVQHFDRAGRVDEAIAAARRVLRLYPESPQASQAHEVGKKYEARTGGGLIEH